MSVSVLANSDIPLKHIVQCTITKVVKPASKLQPLLSKKVNKVQRP